MANRGLKFNRNINTHFALPLMGLTVFAIVQFTPIASRLWNNVGLLHLSRAMTSEVPVVQQQSAIKAENWIHRATNADGENMSAWRWLGFALLSQGRENEAVETWRNGGGQVESEFMQRGLFSQQVGDSENAITWYRLGQKLQPQVGDWWYYQGLVFVENDQWSSAMKAFTTGLPLILNTVGQSDFYYQQGIVNLRETTKPDFATALSMFDKALNENQFASDDQLIETHFQRAEVLRKTGHSVEALNEYNLVIDYNPDDYRANLMAGILFWQLKNDAKTATRLLKKAISLNPNLVPPRLILANMYYYIGQADMAREMYESVLVIEPNNKAALEQLVILNNK